MTDSASANQAAAVESGPAKSGQLLGAKGTRTRRKIMDATRALLAERSFADVRISDVARVAEIAQPNFYTYFASVEDVVRALAGEVSLDPLARLLEPDWSTSEGLALARQFVEEAFVLWKTHQPVMALSWFFADKRHRDFPQLRINQVRSLYKGFESQIRRAQQARRIDPALQPRLAGYECVGLISSAATKFSLLVESGFSREQLIETNARLLRMIATGIAGPDAAA